MIQRAWMMGWSAAFVLVAACGDGGGAASPAADTQTIDAADTASAADDTGPSVEPDTTPVVPDPPVDTYPPGPYGAEYLETIDPELSFYDPWADRDIKLRDYWLDPNTNVILISSAAGWCTACMYEAWDLVDAYEKYHPDGFEILYTMYADPQDLPLWDDAHRREQDMAFMNDWHDNVGKYIDLDPVKVTNYPLLVDIGYKMGEFYDKSATPFTIMVRTRDMKVIYRAIGYGAGSIEHHIKTALYSN